MTNRRSILFNTVLSLLVVGPLLQTATGQQIEVLPPFDPAIYFHPEDPDDPFGWDTAALAVSGDGEIIVGWADEPTGQGPFERKIVTFKYQNGAMTKLPFSHNFDWDDPDLLGISADGNVIFGKASSDATDVMVLGGGGGGLGPWVSMRPGIEARSTPGGGWIGRGTDGRLVLAVSDDFSTAVGSTAGGQCGNFGGIGGRRPMIWKADREIAIPTMPGASGGEATGVSADGRVVCGYFCFFDVEETGDAGFVWTEETGVQLIRDMARPFGFPFEDDFPDIVPIDVSADGTTVVGRVTGIDATGRHFGFRLRLSGSLRAELALTGLEEDGKLHLGDTFTVRCSITAPASEGELTNVAFEDPLGLDFPDLFALAEAAPDISIGTLDERETVAFEWPLKVVRPGAYTLKNFRVAGRNADGKPIQSNIAELTGNIPGFEVEIVYPEETLVLEPKDDDGNVEDEAGYEPVEFEVIVRVSVPEGGEPIEDVAFQGFDASDGGLDIDLVRATGIEETPWVDVQPQPVPMPVYVSQRSETGVVPGVLQPGGKPAEFRVKVTAERPGPFDMAALVTAAPEGGGKTLRARGNKVVEIKGDLVLSVQLEVVTKPARITEGEAVEITGVVENLTLDKTIELDPLIVLSSGQGVPLGPVALDDPLPLAGTPGIFNPKLEPGQSERFRLRVQTVALPGFDQREMARTSVVIDFAVSGKIVDEKGMREDLEPTATLVEWGNGRYEVEGATFLRVPVDADLRPSRQLDAGEFFIISAGNAMEQFAKGGGEALMAIPQMIGSLPSVFWGLANVGGSIQAERQIASHNAARYLWAWLDWKTDVWLDLESETRRQQFQLISDELYFYYGDKFDSVDEVKQLVDSAITGYFTRVIDYRKRAYDVSGYGFNAELAEIVGEPFRPIGGFAVEELASSLAIAAWMGKASRSAQVLDEVAEKKQLFIARSRKQADEATAEMARRGDPRITEMPDPMKALPASTPLTRRHALDGWGIDPVSDANLIKMTDTKNGGMPIFVAIRSRADETIEWMKTQLGITPKPMTFKPKNANADDVKYLGYRDGVGYGDANGVGAGDRGATLLAEPIPRSKVIERLDASGADEVTRKRVLERHTDRWEEWYGHTNLGSRVIDQSKSKVWELKNRLTFDASTNVGKGTLGVPKRGSVPQPDINADTVGPGILDARQFEMRQVKNPPDDDLFEGGRQYFECWLEDDLGTPTSRGALRRIAGDIDTVAVGLADGSALSVASEFSETVAKNLLHGIQAQHPWSNSLVIKKLYEKFVNNGTHRWHDDIAKRGEPLIVYVNGERRVGWFHPTRTITRENPLQGFMWVDGGTADVDNVIRFQKDLRGSLPDPTEGNPPLVKPITSLLREAMLDSDINKSSNLIATCTVETAKAGGTLFRLSRNTIFEKRNDDGSWEPADPTAGCGGDGIVVMPETFLTGGVVPGMSRLPIIEDLLGFDWREMFAIGDQIIIDPGAPTEEHRTITGHGSLILDRPLTFSHAATARIVSLGQMTDDNDSDGLSNDREALLGTDPNAPDSDGDGREDFTEVQSGTDPLHPDPFVVQPKDILTIRAKDSGQWELVWPTGLLRLEQSETLAPGSWEPVGLRPTVDDEHRYPVPLDRHMRYFRLNE